MSALKKHLQALEWDKLWAWHPQERAALGPLQARLGYEFQDQKLLFEALTHRSAIMDHSRQNGAEASLTEDPSACLPWNERIEFLGDAVLNLAISTFLWHREESFSEGKLSKIRSSLVNCQCLANIAREFRIEEAILLGKGEKKAGGREREALLADTLEALIGAVYLDGGMEAASKLIERLFFQTLRKPLQEDPGDYKTRLQEWVQDTHHQTPRYKLLAESGPDHAKEFEVAVYLGQTLLASGLGCSKKQASQKAAHNAWLALRKREDELRKPIS